MNGPFQPIPEDRPARIVGLRAEPDGILATIVMMSPPQDGEKRPNVRFRSHTRFEPDPSMSEAVARIRSGEPVTPQDLADASLLLSEALAAATETICEKGRVPIEDIDLIGMRGVYLTEGTTSPIGLQLGEPAIVAERTGVPVVSGFEVHDVAAGGQGAPLSALADWILFGTEGVRRTVQRLGPTGSVTVLPPSDDPSEVLAFDTGPGTLLIDTVARHVSGGTQGSDVDGSLALQGVPDEAIVDDLLPRSFFEVAPPKLGRGFDAPYADEFLQVCESRGLSAADTVATATLLVARAVTDQYRRFVPEGLSEVIVGGPGSDNPALVGMLLGSLYPMSVVRYQDKGWPETGPEAAVYAILAWYAWHGQAGDIPGTTGAKGPRVLGSFTPGAAQRA